MDKTQLLPWLDQVEQVDAATGTSVGQALGKLAQRIESKWLDFQPNEVGGALLDGATNAPKRVMFVSTGSQGGDEALLRERYGAMDIHFVAAADLLSHAFEGAALLQ